MNITDMYLFIFYFNAITLLNVLFKSINKITFDTTHYSYSI